VRYEGMAFSTIKTSIEVNYS